MPTISYACPVCFGAPESPLTEGMNMAILTLLGIIGTLLGMFGAFFIYLRNRAKQYSVSSMQ
ncbi:MAG: hypothetical protein ACE5I1_08750 [bacterium]